MNSKALWKSGRNEKFVVAPAGDATWVVAFSRQLIPGALFKTRHAAVGYASLLASATGLTRTSIKVLGDA